MRVTLDLPWSLVEEARGVCEREGISFDALVAEALEATLAYRPFALRDGSTPSGPLKPEFEGNWAAVRDEIYRGRGT